MHCCVVCIILDVVICTVVCKVQGSEIESNANQFCFELSCIAPVENLLNNVIKELVELFLVFCNRHSMSLFRVSPHPLQRF